MADYINSISCQDNYDYEISHETKKIRDDDEKLLQSRERNKVHARNTRERKKIQMDAMLLRIESLQREKMDLSKQLLDTTVADILVCLSTNSASNTTLSEASSGTSSEDSSTSSNISESKLKSLERIKLEISQDMNDDNDDLKMDMELLSKDKASCTIQDLENIRRERNRVHAKRTRIRKKRVMMELEANIAKLEDDVRDLRIRVQIYNRKKCSMALPAISSDMDENDVGPEPSLVSTSTSALTSVEPMPLQYGFPPVALPGYEQFAIPIPYNVVMYGNGMFPHSSGCTAPPPPSQQQQTGMPSHHQQLHQHHQLHQQHPQHPMPQQAIEFLMSQTVGYPYVNMDGSHGNHHSLPQAIPFCPQWPPMMSGGGGGGVAPMYGPPFAMVPIVPFGMGIDNPNNRAPVSAEPSCVSIRNEGEIAEI